VNPGSFEAALIVAAYFIAISAIGILFSGKGDGLLQFHLAGRAVKGPLLVGTLCATIVGASATIGMAGLGFRHGLPGAWWLLSGVIGLFILHAGLAEKVRRSGCYTLPELIGSFYGPRVRTACAALIVAAWIGIISAQITASGTVLGALFGGNPTIFMVISAAIFVIYTAHGGQRSVIRTDLIQFIIIVAGIALLLFESLKALSLSGIDLRGSISFPFSESMGPEAVASMVLVVGSAYLVGPDIYSRLLSASTPGDARRAVAVSAILLIPLAFSIAFCGILARFLLPDIAPEQALPGLMMAQLTPVERGIMASALLAAFMSSADTTLLTASSILTMDLFRSARPGAKAEELLAISRASAVVLGAFALGLAASGAGIIATLLAAYSIFTGGMLVPTIAGFYRDRLGVRPKGAFCSLIGGGTVALLIGKSYPLAGMAVSFILLFAVSFIDRRLFNKK
jgi:SSS family solute:Na+ symporter